MPDGCAADVSEAVGGGAVLLSEGAVADLCVDARGDFLMGRRVFLSLLPGEPRLSFVSEGARSPLLTEVGCFVEGRSSEWRPASCAKAAGRAAAGHWVKAAHVRSDEMVIATDASHQGCIL
jgi:hypothetical protein